MKKQCICLKASLLILLLLILCVSVGSCTEKQDVLGWNFFEITKIDPEAVSSIYVEYLGVSVPLDLEAVEQILESFTLAECTEILKSEPFNESEFVLSLDVKGEKIEIPICWFNGLEYDEQSNVMGYKDRRFDIFYCNSWYVFQQDIKTFWNEDYLATEFYKVVRQEDIPIQAKYEADGYEAHSSLGGYDTGRWSLNLVVDEDSTEKILNESDIILIVTFQEYYDMIRYESDDVTIEDRVFQVKVNEILKGKVGDDTIYVQPEFYTSIINDIEYVTYPPTECPDMKKNKQYLVCLEEEIEIDTKLYQLRECATIVNEVLYPRYNTEYHPFYKVSVEEIRNYIKDSNR